MKKIGLLSLLLCTSAVFGEESFVVHALRGYGKGLKNVFTGKPRVMRAVSPATRKSQEGDLFTMMNRIHERALEDKYQEGYKAGYAAALADYGIVLQPVQESLLLDEQPVVEQSALVDEQIIEQPQKQENQITESEVADDATLQVLNDNGISSDQSNNSNAFNGGNE